MSISCSLIPLENATKKLNDLKGKKDNLPEYLKLRQAWITFGKWMVQIGESDQNQIKIGGGGYEKSGHVCIVLRGIGFTLYFYQLIDEYTKEQYKIFDNMRLLLDRVLIANQCVSYKLKFYLEKEGWSGNIFPKFFKEYDNKEIVKWADKIDDDIDKYSNTEYVYKKINRKKYHEYIVTDDEVKFDIKGCYAELLSILNTIKPTLPQNNIIIIDDLIEKCEHGYYLGFLLEKALKKYNKKYVNTDKKNIRYKNFLEPKLQKFIKGRENRVITASKEAFGLTPEVIKRLNRMFVYKIVK